MGKKVDIVYVHQGAPRVYEIVHAIMRAGYSCRFLSGYYFKEDALPERVLKSLPGSRAKSAYGALTRRHLAKLPADVVERSWMQDILMWIEHKFRRLVPNFLITRARYIDIRAAIRVRMLKPRAVIVCDSHALYTLRAARKVGAIAILDQVIGHVDAGNRILSEEKALLPEIGSAFEPTPARMVRRCIREVREADYIFVPSEYVRDSLLPFGADPARIFLIPYGVDLRQFSPSPPGTVPPFRVLFAGAIGLRKGVYYLLDALRRADLPGARAVLLGKIEGDGEWLKKFDGLFTHIPHLPHQEIPAVFADADIYVYPSLHEGSTVSIYEAMASGLPVVTTPNSGSVLRDGVDGYIVAPRDTETLRARIEQLYGDADLRERMGKSAAERAVTYSWDAYSKRVGDALKTVLNGPAS